MRHALLAALLMLLVPSATASALEVRIEGSTVVYRVGPGEQANVSVHGLAGDSFVFSDQNNPTVVAPCTREPESTTVRCPAAGLTGARFELGDGNDNVSNDQEATAHLPIVVIAGAGDDMVLGTRANDAIDGGPGDDSLPGWFGDDQIAGGPGNDDVRPQEGDDVADGGPGNDFVNGGEGNDVLAAGTGKDEVTGAEGDDRIDMRNGEIDTRELIACAEGTEDTIVLDPADQVLEFRQPNGVWWVESTCETVEGQTAALKPKNVFLKSSRPLTATVDVTNALPTTITVELRVRGRVVARGTAQRKGPRTSFRLSRTAAGRRVHGLFVPGTIRATIRDSAGRTSQKSSPVTITRL